ncbi:MAG TPA: FG-GAP-like repeat-containing protein [Candidatus Polarisedimenticolia bacterium]|nr:FG-GAP-like repeat-containing protein [Candidatus Polarisedimenticolia bacterium]
MHRARPVRVPPIAILVAIALFAGPRVGAASSITSRILIDPVGENFGDVFGSSVAWVGDVNGDGYDDLLIGAFHYPETASVGQAYLYFGGPALDSVADLVIPAPAGGGGLFGASVASAGDFNGDGYPDFIIGAPQSSNEGKAFIYYGGPSLDATPDLTLIGESTGSLTMFGASVATARDVNGDGFDDVIVGAPHYGRTSGEWDGRAYVFFGGAVPDAVPDRVFSAVGSQDQMGTAVGSAGDMNGDGHPDLFASAPYNDTPVLNAGAIYVWFGGPGFDTTPDLVLHGSGINERLSLTAANAGDVNADGFSDLIGAEKDHVYVWFGGSSPNPVADLTFAGSYSSVAGAGDVNGDGIDDFAVGAPNDVSGGLGRVSVYFGGSAVDTVEDLDYVGDSGGDIGLCIAGGGHVDGPGPADLIVSAYYDPDSIGYNQGRVYVFANSPSCGGTPVLPPAVNSSVSLVRDGSGTTISWTDPPGPYNVYRGTRSGGSPWAYNQTCHDSHIATSSVQDSENPPIGTMFFYLVTRVDACGESIPGQDSGGHPNPNPSPCP